jgi:hypothetical protein
MLITKITTISFKTILIVKEDIEVIITMQMKLEREITINMVITIKIVNWQLDNKIIMVDMLLIN